MHNSISYAESALFAGRIEFANPTGAHRPLGVVLAGDGGAEYGHNRIPDELLHRALEALDLPLDAGVVGAEGGAHVLGVGLVGAVGEADQVDEEDGDDLALLGMHCLLECGPAREAEPGSLRVLLVARAASAHSQSV